MLKVLDVTKAIVTMSSQCDFKFVPHLVIPVVLSSLFSVPLSVFQILENKIFVHLNHSLMIKALPASIIRLGSKLIMMNTNYEVG